MSFNAGNIVGTLSLNKSPFAKGMLQAQGITAVFGQSISTFMANPLLGVANMAKKAFGAIGKLVTNTANAADGFAKMSKSTGASIEFLSGLDHAAKLSGTSFSAVSTGMARLSRTASDAEISSIGASIRR